MITRKTVISDHGFSDEFFANRVQKVIRKWSKPEGAGWPATRAAFNIVSDCAGLDCSTPAKVGALSRRGRLAHYSNAFLLLYKKRPALFLELLAAVEATNRDPIQDISDVIQRTPFLTEDKKGLLPHADIAEVISKRIRRKVTDLDVRVAIHRESKRREKILRRLGVTENQAES